MKKTILTISVLVLTALFPVVIAKEPHSEVASQLVKLINTADYPGVQALFNKDMDEALPLKKTTEFLTALTRKYGKIGALGEPKRTAGWTIFPADCQHGALNIALALDDEGKIAGLTFKPREESQPAAAEVEVANRLVKLINAKDYAAIDALFTRQMREALPLPTASKFFNGLTSQVGEIKKLGEPKTKADWTIFSLNCERGTLNMSLALDDQNKVAGLTFQPAQP